MVCPSTVETWSYCLQCNITIAVLCPLCTVADSVRVTDYLPITATVGKRTTPLPSNFSIFTQKKIHFMIFSVER